MDALRRIVFAHGACFGVCFGDETVTRHGASWVGPASEVYHHLRLPASVSPFARFGFNVSYFSFFFEFKNVLIFCKIGQNIYFPIQFTPIPLTHEANAITAGNQQA